MKLCKDCKHSDFWSGIDNYGQYHHCLHPLAFQHRYGDSPVVGKFRITTTTDEFDGKDCSNVRKDEQRCGKDGKWWEEKEKSLLQRIFG